MILVFDTETSGLVQSKLPDEYPTQPYLVQLACLVFNDDGGEMGSVNLIVKPDTWVIPDEAAKIHGITTEIAKQYGIPLQVVMGVFFNLRAQATTLVAHNIDFDTKIMRINAAKIGRSPTHPGPAHLACTMNMAMPIMKLPPTPKMVAAGFDKFKPPSLSQATKHFFNEELEGAHDAMVDAKACARLYFHITNLDRSA